jgi:hypothetical protein
MAAELSIVRGEAPNVPHVPNAWAAEVAANACQCRTCSTRRTAIMFCATCGYRGQPVVHPCTCDWSCEIEMMSVVLEHERREGNEAGADRAQQLLQWYQNVQIPCSSHADRQCSHGIAECPVCACEDRYRGHLSVT